MAEGITMSLGEHRLVLRETLINGQVRIECEMEGDGVKRAEEHPEADVSTGYLLLATVFQMFADGTLWHEMFKRFGHAPGEVDITTEAG